MTTTQVVASAFALALLLTMACHTHRPVEVEKLLTPLAEADSSQLIDAVNNLAAVHSISGKCDIQFEDTSFATAGIAERYRTADGSITLQRPGKIYQRIQTPVVASDVAQMTSDGAHFKIAVLKSTNEKYRRFVSAPMMPFIRN
jgi:hypothetical protein